jgi:hypothetical protein
MDANSGEPWSEMDIADLTHSLAYGNTFHRRHHVQARRSPSLRFPPPGRQRESRFCTT